MGRSCESRFRSSFGTNVFLHPNSNRARRQKALPVQRTNKVKTTSPHCKEPLVGASQRDEAKPPGHAEARVSPSKKLGCSPAWRVGNQVKPFYLINQLISKPCLHFQPSFDLQPTAAPLSSGTRVGSSHWGESSRCRPAVVLEAEAFPPRSGLLSNWA